MDIRQLKSALAAPAALAVLILVCSLLATKFVKIAHPGIQLRSADLVFVCDGGSDFDSAISAATADSSLSFTHVGLVEVCKDSVFILEAEPQDGVVRSSLEEFTERNGSDNLRFYRISGAEIDREAAVKTAKTFLGQAYDFAYLPDNGRMYCSELVYESCRDRYGKRIFQSVPMNFQATDGSIPEFWVNLFSAQGIPVPQGVPGTNPNDLSKSPVLRRL